MLKKEDIDLCYVFKLANGTECYLAERIGTYKQEIVLYGKGNKYFDGVTTFCDLNNDLQDKDMNESYSVTHYYRFNSQNEAIRAILDEEDIRWIQINQENDKSQDWGCYLQEVTENKSSLESKELSLLDKVFQKHVEVILRSGEELIGVGDKCMCSKDLTMGKNEYEDDLTYGDNDYDDYYDIMKATLNGEVIYERKEEYTQNDIDWSKVEVGTEFYVSDDAEFNCMFIYKFACIFNGKPYFKKIESDDGCLYSWNYYKPANKLTY